MKIMGMDIGEKRIGIALSDDGKKFSIPHSIINNDKNFSFELSRILEKESIEKIVVGMPYTLKGEIGDQGKKILDFVRNNILDMGVEVVYQDERFTSKVPLETSSNRKKMKKQKDKFSAALILWGYLERTLKIKKA